MLTDRLFKTEQGQFRWFNRGAARGKREQKPLREIKAGDILRHRLRSNGIETAYVVHVQRDQVGVPHVIYDCCLEVSHLAPLFERRTLALESFNERYEEQVD